MKLNEDSSKTRSKCEEESLLCIFKDVPNYLQEEGEISTVGGSHQDILVGRQVGHSSFLAKDSSDSTKTYVLQLNSNEVESRDNLAMKLHTRQPNKKLKDQCPLGEVKVWSSPSEESLLSDDSLPGITKKRRKKTKRHYRSFGNPNLNLSIDVLRFPDIEMTVSERFTSTDDLCSECLWLVRTAEEAKVSSSSEDLGIATKWNQQTTDSSTEHTLDGKAYTEKDVLNILNQVHFKLVECSIFLTTHKLKKKVKRNVDKETLDTLSDEKLLDEIQDEEESKNGTSKLCLVLGKLVSKFLKYR